MNDEQKIIHADNILALRDMSNRQKTQQEKQLIRWAINRIEGRTRYTPNPCDNCDYLEGFDEGVKSQQRPTCCTPAPSALPPVPEGEASWEGWLRHAGYRIQERLRDGDGAMEYEWFSLDGMIFKWRSGYMPYPAALAAAIKHAKEQQDD